MTAPWFKNYVGVKLSDDQMRDISHPNLELTAHVTMKTVQTFGLIGTMFVGPILALARKDTRNWSGVQAKMTQAGQVGLGLGLLAGPLMTYARMRSVSDPDGAYDRCYRLRYNRTQVKVDRASILGFVGGAGIAYYMAGDAIFGGLVGMSGGIIITSVLNSIF
ncbi:hypothetical protein ACJMK2_015350 [Sinanodonta woodiana]|uniref:Uncharacterized protein n=1 Tax=Sinanodonta woodiana TaxID=1069815 RepID=A0ABD3UTP6_SINWO